MRTTLDIEDPVLNAVKDMARQQGRTAGEVASDLLRRALTQPAASIRDAPGRYGFRPFAAAPSEDRVTNEQVNQLRDQLGI